MSERIVVAMSGGVDSSVAAALMVEQGYDVIGVTLQLWGKDVCADSGTRLCCSVRDALDAKSVAKLLGARHEVLELSELFHSRVIRYFTDSYQQGLTPNPCIACNDHIKFGALMNHADALGARQVVTGHYAASSIDPATQRAQLRRSSDSSKDQSYVLFNLTQEQLSRAQFPLGSMNKEAVREKARQLGFRTADKPDSQDICFVRDRNKNNFLRKELPEDEEQSGPIVDTLGRVLGRHQGLLGFTIGQREGIGVAASHRLYVVAIDKHNNRLIVGKQEELYSSALIAERLNWVSIPAPPQPIRAQAKIRARHEGAAVTVYPEGSDRMRVCFDEPQQAITPGQAVVLYQDDLVLGGGWIAQALPEDTTPRALQPTASTLA